MLLLCIFIHITNVDLHMNSILIAIATVNLLLSNDFCTFPDIPPPPLFLIICWSITFIIKTSNYPYNDFLSKHLDKKLSVEQFLWSKKNAILSVSDGNVKNSAFLVLSLEAYSELRRPTLVQIARQHLPSQEVSRTFCGQSKSF